MTTDNAAAPAPAPATAPAAAAAPAPAATPAAAPADPAQAPAPAAAAPAPVTFESLIHGTAAPAPAPDAAPSQAPAEANPLTSIASKLPEKFHVKAGDGSLDAAASLAKALEHRDHLERRLGAGELPPKSPAEYTFDLPPELEGFQLTSERFENFRAEAHKANFTPAQFRLAMSAYLAAAPDLMAGAAKLSADQARAELSKIWPVTEDMSRNLDTAKRAMQQLPADLQEATRAYGTDPAFLRVLHHFGAQMREDAAPVAGGASAGGMSIDAMMASKAYMDPKHPDHARVSQAVARHFAGAAGTAPVY